MRPGLDSGLRPFENCPGVLVTFQPLLPPVLTRSHRGVLPFRLAATSFVFPAGWAQNARLLGTVFDEIQLLFFEGAPASLPSAAEIKDLIAVAKDSGVGYSVHLPLDVYLGSNSDKIRNCGVDSVVRLVDATAAVNPRTYILHLEYQGEHNVPDMIKRWQDNCRLSLEAIGRKGFRPDRLAVENLDYPFDWVAPLIADFGLKVCIDPGHLIAAGIDPAAFLKAKLDHAVMIHLYGNPGPGQHRHLALDRVAPEVLASWLTILRDFKKTVCLEVFNPVDLAASLTYLEDCWQERRL